MEGTYSLEDPVKIQGRDDVALSDLSLAALRLQRALDVLPDGSLSILSPGSGAGRYTRAMARYRPSWEIVGGDLSQLAVDEANRAGGGPEYVAFDAEHMPFDDQSFDAVVFFDLLEHVPNPDQFMNECRRVLRSGGRMHFFVPLEGQLFTLYHLFERDKLVPIQRWKREHVGHIQHYRDVDVLKLVWDAGFVEVSADYSFHIVGQIHDIVDYWNRNRLRGGSGRVPASVVSLITRLTFLVTWRLAYLEDRLLTGRFLASGLHLTVRRP